MGDRVSEKIVPSPNDGDLLDRAGNALLGMLQQAAAITEENSKRALDVAHELSGKLRAAEDRIRELEADIRYYKDRADRADQWLHHISVEIEKRFFEAADGRSRQGPSRQTGSPGLRPTPRAG